MLQVTYVHAPLLLNEHISTLRATQSKNEPHTPIAQRDSKLLKVCCRFDLKPNLIQCLQGAWDTQQPGGTGQMFTR